MKGWLFLAATILFELSGTISLKLSYGFTRPLPSVLMFIFYASAYTCLNIAIKTIDMSVAYAIWSGVGLTLVSVIGFYFFDESFNLVKALSIALIIIGIVGVNLADKINV